jgi:hypothetical protein
VAQRDEQFGVQLLQPGINPDELTLAAGNQSFQLAELRGDSVTGAAQS